MDIIKALKKHTAVAQSVNRYKLAGMEQPHVKSSAELYLDHYGNNFKEIVDHFNLDDLKLKLKDFQIVGVVVALMNLYKYGGFMIADNVGLGKTVQSISAAKAILNNGDAQKVLVVSPKNIKYQWAREIKKFTDYKAVVVDGYKKEKRLEVFDEEADFYIINYSQLIIDEDYQRIKEISPDIIIADEAHKFKNLDTSRTKALYSLSDEIRFKLMLTATPLQNDPLEIYSLFNFINPDLFTNQSAFKKDYLVYTFAKNYTAIAGGQNLFELEKLISPFYIRRTRSDVKDELPSDHYEDVYVTMNEKQKALDAIIINQIDEMRGRIDMLAAGDKKSKKKAVELEDTILGYKAIRKEIAGDPRVLLESESAKIKSMAEETLPEGYMSTKFKHVMDFVKEKLSENEKNKIIIFSEYARMVKLFYKEIGKFYSDRVMVYGQLDEKNRDENVERFFENKECRVFIGSDAASVGYNLQVANYLINFDTPWNPSVLKQRNGRIIRIGSAFDDVYIKNMISRDSIDEDVKKSVERKEHYFDSLIENTKRQEKILDKIAEKVG